MIATDDAKRAHDILNRLERLPASRYTWRLIFL